MFVISKTAYRLHNEVGHQANWLMRWGVMM